MFQGYPPPPKLNAWNLKMSGLGKGEKKHINIINPKKHHKFWGSMFNFRGVPSGKLNIAMEYPPFLIGITSTSSIRVHFPLPCESMFRKILGSPFFGRLGKNPPIPPTPMSCGCRVAVVSSLWTWIHHCSWTWHLQLSDGI